MKVRKILMSLVIFTLMAVLCIGVFSTSAVSDDPADSYQKIDAPDEDSSIALWFEPSFKKVLTSDTTPSGKDTYSVYMAKNEVENAQFVLYSDENKTNLKASVTKFTNENGDSITASLYHEMYVTTEKLDKTSVLGSTEETTFIREGETPDPVAKLNSSRKFALNGGKSQALFIKLKTKPDTPAGWYKGTLSIKQGSKTVKTADVFAYVWDFEIPDKTDLQTSFYLDNNTAYGGTYSDFYDYLLENRINAMDIPGTLNSSNPYLTDDRVNSIRVTHNGGGNVKSYMDDLPGLYSNYTSIYDDLYNSGKWDSIKDKLYFYTADEPMAQEQQYATGRVEGKTVDDVKERSEKLENYWPGAQTVVPYHENHPYPYYTLNAPMSTFGTADKKDATQEMMDSNSVRVWCPQIYAFTPQSVLKSIGYGGGYNATDKIRDLSGTISGMYSTSPVPTVGTATGQYFSEYYNWADIYGQFDNRIKSYIYNQNASGENYKLWTYSAGWNKSYSYCNHLIENTGLQTKMLFWQLYQNDITGYLYYGTNNWSEYDYNNGTFVDTTVTGDYTPNWKTNRHNYATGYSIFGNGTLIYGNAQAKNNSISGVIGSLRVEIMRDGIEEYQMFKMLEELKGNDAAKAIVSKVSNNVVDYLSMPAFNAEGQPEGMDNYDYMEAVRRELGNAVEAASAEEACEHEWDEGTVTLEATCTVMGEKHFTCAKCGMGKTEIIPTLHSVGDTYTVISGSPASCTSEGKQVMKCDICGNEKTVTEKAFHDDPAHYVYKESNANNHSISCDVCGKTIQNAEAHSFNTVYTNTCTEDGQKLSQCRFCGYSTVIEDNIPAKGHDLVSRRVEPTCTEDGFEGLACTRCDYTEANVLPATGHTAGDTPTVTKPATCTENGIAAYTCTVCGKEISDNVEIIPALGHDYANGTCTVCGERDPEYVPEGLGDINNDGVVNLKDSNMLKRIISGSYDANEEERAAADINGDNSVTTKDSFALKRIILGMK